MSYKNGSHYPLDFLPNLSITTRNSSIPPPLPPPNDHDVLFIIPYTISQLVN